MAPTYRHRVFKSLIKLGSQCCGVPHRRVEVLAVGLENQFVALVLACLPSTLILIPDDRDREFARLPTLVLHLSFVPILNVASRVRAIPNRAQLAALLLVTEQLRWVVGAHHE